MKFLSGSGNVKKYGPTLLIGAVFNPVLIAGLYFLLPVEYKILSIPISFSVLLLIVHLVALPKLSQGTSKSHTLSYFNHLKHRYC